MMVVGLMGVAASTPTDWSAPVAWLVVAGAFLAALASGIRAYRRPYLGKTTAAAGAGQTGDLLEPDAATMPESRSLRRLDTALVIALGGYLFLDRGFAWIHIPGTPAFVGELVILLGVVAMLGNRTSFGSALRLASAPKALAAYMAWGALLLVLAVATYGVDAIRDAALWYYGIVAVFVVVLVISRPERINRWLKLFGRAIPYYLIWFPAAAVIDSLLHDSVPTIPDSQVPFTSHKIGNMAVMAAAGVGFLWLVDKDSKMYTERQRVGLTSLATLVILFAGMKNRGGFVAAALALAVALVFLRRKRSEVSMVMIGAVVVMLVVGLLGNVKLSIFDESQREVSVEQLLRNLSSIIDSDSGGAREQETVTWRLQIWIQVLEDVTSESPLSGFGPGPDLGKRYNISSDADVPLRNPHNSHVGILARSGFVGVGLWAMIWLLWVVELLMTRSRLLARGRSVEAGVLGWLIVSSVAILVNAIFDPTLEGPQVAWWLWAELGLGMGIVVLDRTGRLAALSLSDRQLAPRSLVDRPVVVGERLG